MVWAMGVRFKHCSFILKAMRSREMGLMGSASIENILAAERESCLEPD
jgi:hypothetical protein